MEEQYTTVWDAAKQPMPETVTIFDVMEAQETGKVIEPVVSEVIPEPAPENSVPEIPEATEPIVYAKPVDPTRENNLRYLRQEAELKKRLERENLELMARLKAFEESRLAVQESEYEDPSSKQLKTLSKQIESLTSEIAAQKAVAREQLVDQQLLTEIPDFKQVVNHKTVESFAEQYPLEANTLRQVQDPYQQSILAYNMLKRYGFAPEPVNTNAMLAAKQTQAALDKNKLKPRPLASISPQQGDSPLSKANAFANGLSGDLQKQLWQEMKDAMKGR